MTCMWLHYVQGACITFVASLSSVLSPCAPVHESLSHCHSHLNMQGVKIYDFRYVAALTVFGKPCCVAAYMQVMGMVHVDPRALALLSVAVKAAWVWVGCCFIPSSHNPKIIAQSCAGPTSCEPVMHYQYNHAVNVLEHGNLKSTSPAPLAACTWTRQQLHAQHAQQPPPPGSPLPAPSHPTPQLSQPQPQGYHLHTPAHTTCSHMCSSHQTCQLPSF